MNKVLSYIFLAMVSFLLSCSGAVQQGDLESVVIEQEQESIYTKAQKEYTRKNYVVAEQLYLQIVAKNTTPIQYKIEAFLNLASISSRRTDYMKTLSYTEQAMYLEPKLMYDNRWYSLWESSIVFLGDARAIDAVNAVLSNASSSQIVTAKIYILGAYTLWINGRIVEALQYLQDAWHIARTVEEKSELEEILLGYTKKTSKETFAVLFSTVTEENKATFPYSIFYLEQAMRLQTLGDKKTSFSMLDSLQKNKIIYNKKILTMLPKEKTIKESGDINIVLLLPLSSGYKQFSWQVVNGATIAQEMLGRVDSKIKLHFINTETKNWLQKLSAFPKGTLVGGPLRQSIFDIISKSALLSKYIFFTFLQTLPENIEGNKAWRFYSSPQDQINALLTFTNALGINSYGVLFPQDTYGGRMASLLKSTAPRFNGSVVKMQRYGIKTAEWSKVVEEFLSTTMVEGQPVPNANFKATFLPDSFANATILIPSFFYNGEQRQVIMGTSLWEERSVKSSYISSNFSLVIYPSTWNPHSKVEHVKELEKRLLARSFPSANRWSSLGYDFTRYAYALAKANVATASDINIFIATPNRINWTSAPILWSNKGIATQRLFILSPSGESGVVVSPKSFSLRVQKAYNSHNERVKAVFGEEEK